MIYKLGKRRAVHDIRTLKLSNYLDIALPSAPVECDWTNKVTTWGMMLNDKLGICAIAGPGHIEMGWTSQVHKLFIPTDDQLVIAYSSIAGYDPKATPDSITGDNPTDKGCIMLDVLKYWRNVGIAGRCINSFVGVSADNMSQVHEAIFLFGALNIGLALPKFIEKQMCNGMVWDKPANLTGDNEPGSLGGHCVPILKYKPGILTCITWGGLQDMTEAFFQTYCDEAYACLSINDWTSGRVAPNQLRVIELQRDLSAFAQAG